MSKFLNLIEENDPKNNGNPMFDLLDFLKSKGIHAYPIRGTDMVYIDTGETTIAVTISPPEEENEIATTVETMASEQPKNKSGVFGNVGKQIEASVAKRKPVITKMLKAYNTETDMLNKKSQIKSKPSPVIKSTY